jgi:hypothetical protein
MTFGLPGAIAIYQKGWSELGFEPAGEILVQTPFEREGAAGIITGLITTHAAIMQLIRRFGNVIIPPYAVN